jgi:hypothetical protein
VKGWGESEPFPSVKRTTFANIITRLLACSKSFPCEAIQMENVNLSYGNKEAQSLYKNAKGIKVNFVKPPLVC